jgi:MFS family permease
MSAILSSVGAIILGMGIVQIGNGLLTTLLGLRMGIEGYPTWVVGLVMSGYFAGQIVGARLIPRVIERVGHIRTFAAAAPSWPRRARATSSSSFPSRGACCA